MFELQNVKVVSQGKTGIISKVTGGKNYILRLEVRFPDEKMGNFTYPFCFETGKLAAENESVNDMIIDYIELQKEEIALIDVISAGEGIESVEKLAEVQIREMRLEKKLEETVRKK